MLNDKFLERWTNILVPKEFGPDKHLDNGLPLLGIYIVPSDKMEDIKDYWYSGLPKDSKIYGLLVDIGSILELAGRKESNLGGKFVIRLNESQSEAAGIFSLLHEVGHLSGILTSNVAHEEDPDEFADSYALKKVLELIQEPVLRAKVFFEAFSNEYLRA